MIAEMLIVPVPRGTSVIWLALMGAYSCVQAVLWLYRRLRARHAN